MSAELMTILTVDSDPEFTRYVGLLLQNHPGVTLKSASSLNEARVLLANNEIDVVILDVGSSSQEDLKAVKSVREQHPDVSVVVLSSHENHDCVTRCADYGATAYLLKQEIKPNQLWRTLWYAFRAKTRFPLIEPSTIDSLQRALTALRRA